MSRGRTGDPSAAPPIEAADPLEVIATSLRGLRYGQIVIQVHDGAVVQIERTEKLRPRR